jgi:hypothetical protein
MTLNEQEMKLHIGDATEFGRIDGFGNLAVAINHNEIGVSENDLKPTTTAKGVGPGEEVEAEKHKPGAPQAPRGLWDLAHFRNKTK